MLSRVFTSIFVVALSLLGGPVAGAATEQRLGAPSRRSDVSEESFRQLMQTQNQQHDSTLETCAERMMLNDHFLECVRDDLFYTADCGGALVQRTGDWCILDGVEVCCGDSISCCECSGAGIVVGIILLGIIILSIVLASCACCSFCPLYRFMCCAKRGRKIVDQAEAVCLSPGATQEASTTTTDDHSKA